MKKIIKEEVLDNNKVIYQTVYNLTRTNTYDRIVLPRIKTKELLKRYKKVKPIVFFDDIYYSLREFSIFELKNVCYLFNIPENKIIKISSKKIETIGEFFCYHSYNVPEMFIPSIEEILSQFPDDLLNEANGFCLSYYPQCIDDFRRQWEMIAAGCHKSKVKALVIKK